MFRSAKPLAVLTAIVCLIGAGGPVEAALSSDCDVAKATRFGAAADRYSAHGRYVDAAQWYLAATRSTSACRGPQDVLFNARLLARAGVAFAQIGDYARALELIRTVQTKLALIGRDAGQTSPAAQSLLDLTGDLVTMIETMARLSM